MTTDPVTPTESTVQAIEKTIPTVFADESPDEVKLPEIKTPARTHGDIVVYTPDHPVSTPIRRREARVYTHKFEFCPSCGKAIDRKLVRPFYGTTEEWYRCANTECLRCWYLTRDSNGIATIEPQTVNEFLADLATTYKKGQADNRTPNKSWSSGDLTPTA